MVSIRSDPVLMTVGIILIIAIFAGISASIATPAEPGQKNVKYLSTGKAALESPCCKDQSSLTSGCASSKGGECQKGCMKGQKGCSKGGFTSCRNK